MPNRAETLGTYIRKVLDVNKDGQITIKDFLGLFPNNAIAVAMLFVDLVVLVAEYRVWDVGLKITDNNPYKAFGFVLVSAIPFYLGQMFWLYPRASFGQKLIAVLFAGGGLYTSALFGLADLNKSYDVAAIIAWVIKLTVAYIVLALFYILIDNTIKAWRAKVTAHAAVELEKELQSLTRSMLSEWQETKRMERETIDLFGGDEEAVMAQLRALRGKKDNKQQNNQPNPQPVYNQTVQGQDQQERHQTLEDILFALSMTRDQARLNYPDYDRFADVVSRRFNFISGKTMRRAHAELMNGHVNPQTGQRR